MANVLAQMAKSKGIYLTLSLWSMLSPRLARNETSKCLPEEHSNKAVEQDERDDVDVKGESIVSPRIGGI
jgi:hypothetical protein